MKNWAELCKLNPQRSREYVSGQRSVEERWQSETQWLEVVLCNVRKTERTARSFGWWVGRRGRNLSKRFFVWMQPSFVTLPNALPNCFLVMISMRFWTGSSTQTLGNRSTTPIPTCKAKTWTKIWLKTDDFPWYFSNLGHILCQMFVHSFALHVGGLGFLASFWNFFL